MNKALSHIRIVAIMLTVAMAFSTVAAQQTTFSVSFDEDVLNESIDGRVILILSKNADSEPR